MEKKQSAALASLKERDFVILNGNEYVVKLLVLSYNLSIYFLSLTLCLFAVKLRREKL
jgi:hypothetical protein